MFGGSDPSHRAGTSVQRRLLGWRGVEDGANPPRRFVTGRAAPPRRKAPDCVCHRRNDRDCGLVLGPFRRGGTVGSPSQSLRYRLIDLGTLGGPNSSETRDLPLHRITREWLSGSRIPPSATPAIPRASSSTHSAGGEAIGDLGTLPGGVNSLAVWSNNAGEVAGVSENGRIDPLLGIPQGRGVLSKKGGQIVNLGTLGGHESLAAYINNRGRIAGLAARRKRDPFSLFWPGTQTRAFLWQKGIMRDLGTLGGPDALAVSSTTTAKWPVFYTNAAPNPDTGIPTQDPFLWTHGTMADLGTLGGTLASQPPSTTGAKSPAFQPGRKSDCSPLPLEPGKAHRPGHPRWNLRHRHLDEQRRRGCGADTKADKAFHAFFWRKGKMTDLGTINGAHAASLTSSNSRGQVVGTSGICGGAVPRKTRVHLGARRPHDRPEQVRAPRLPPDDHRRRNHQQPGRDRRIRNVSQRRLPRCCPDPVQRRAGCRARAATKALRRAPRHPARRPRRALN